MPSRAASVQIRMRSGSLAGSALKARLHLLAAILPGRAGEDARCARRPDRCRRALPRSRRSSQRRVSSYSVKMISRRSFQSVAGQQIGLDPCDEPVHARIRLERGASRRCASISSTAASSARKSAVGRIGGADDATPPRRPPPRPRRSLASALLVLQPEVFGLVGRAAVDEGLRGGRDDLLPARRRAAAARSCGAPSACAAKAGIEDSSRCCKPDEGELGQRRLLRRQLGDAAACAARRRRRAGARDRAPARPRGRPAIGIGFDLALGKRLAEAPQVRLQPPHHDRLEVPRAAPRRRA